MLSAILSRATFAWKYRQCSCDYFHGDDKELNVLLKHLVDESIRNCSSHSVLLPVSCFSLLRNIGVWNNNRILLLTGDKAFVNESESQGLRDPHIALHGSFSMMVYYNIIAKYFELQGGWSQLTSELDGFKTGMFAFGLDSSKYVSTCLAFEENVVSFSPENFNVLQRCLKDEILRPSVKLVMTLFRLSGHDSDIFFKFREFLTENLVIPHVSEKQVVDICADLKKVYETYYPLLKSRDVAFEIGRLFMGMQRHNDAIDYFINSIHDIDAHYVTYYNLGVCYFHSGLIYESFKHFQLALDIQPDYIEARNWLDKLKNYST